MEREPTLSEIEDFGIKKESLTHKRTVVSVVLFIGLMISFLAVLHKI